MPKQIRLGLQVPQAGPNAFASFVKDFVHHAHAVGFTKFCCGFCFSACGFDETGTVFFFSAWLAEITLKQVPLPKVTTPAPLQSRSQAVQLAVAACRVFFNPNGPGPLSPKPHVRRGQVAPRKLPAPPASGQPVSKIVSRNSTVVCTGFDLGETLERRTQLHCIYN